MRLALALSTLVVAAVALLWLALGPVASPVRPSTAPAAGRPAPSSPAASPPADPAARPASPPPDAALGPPAEDAPAAAVPAPAEPRRHRLPAPEATPVPRPIQAIPTPRVLPAEPVRPASKEAVKRAITSVRPLVADCYRQALAHTPALRGTLKVGFTITADDAGVGRIREAEVLDGGLRQPFLEMCVLESLGSAEYPEPVAGGVLRVTYPFVLEPGGE